MKIICKVTEVDTRGEILRLFSQPLESMALTKTYAASRLIDHIYVPIYSFQNSFLKIH